MKSGQRVTAANRSDFEADEDDEELDEENEVADFQAWLDKHGSDGGGDAPSASAPARAKPAPAICQLCHKDATRCH